VAPPAGNFQSDRQDAIGYRARLRDRQLTATPAGSYVSPVVPPAPRVSAAPAPDLINQTLAALSEIAAEFPARAPAAPVPVVEEAPLVELPDTTAPAPVEHATASAPPAEVDAPEETPAPSASSRKRRRTNRA
jgi:hypothetical protein